MLPVWSGGMWAAITNFLVGTVSRVRIGDVRSHPCPFCPSITFVWQFSGDDVVVKAEFGLFPLVRLTPSSSGSIWSPPWNVSEVFFGAGTKQNSPHRGDVQGIEETVLERQQIFLIEEEPDAFVNHTSRSVPKGSLCAVPSLTCAIKVYHHCAASLLPPGCCCHVKLLLSDRRRFRSAVWWGVGMLAERVDIVRCATGADSSRLQGGVHNHVANREFTFHGSATDVTPSLLPIFEVNQPLAPSKTSVASTFLKYSRAPAQWTLLRSQMMPS